jgi:hypothetical protein
MRHLCSRAVVTNSHGKALLPGPLGIISKLSHRYAFQIDCQGNDGRGLVNSISAFHGLRTQLFSENTVSAPFRLLFL